MQQRPPSFGLNLGGFNLAPPRIRPAMNAAAPLGLNSGGFNLAPLRIRPAMNAAAATLFWSQFERIQPGAAADSTGMAARKLHKITVQMAKNDEK
jgi:hypothetical protein